MTKILILNGPNLNLLGKRQPEIYGSDTLDDVARLCAEAADAFGGEVEMRQSNHEGDLVDWIQDAILDALNTFDGPVIEVHISNIHAREAFRHHSYVSHRANAVIAGCGIQGYVFAVQKIGALLAAK